MKQTYYMLFFFLIATSWCCAQPASLQSVGDVIRIEVSYEKAGQYAERAVEVIEATNVVGSSTDVEYKAGRSVVLLPGFETRTGSVFTALVQKVVPENGRQIQLSSFPNPFERTTTIEYYLPSDGKVDVWITSTQGKVLQKLVDGVEQSAGTHQVEWKAETITSGIYLPVVEINHQRMTGRVVKK